MPLPRVALTMGDPAGIGPELCLKAINETDVLKRCVPIIVGDQPVLRAVGERLDLSLPKVCLAASGWEANFNSLGEAAVLDQGVVSCDDFEPGKVNEKTGRASFQSVNWAIDAAMKHQVDAIVTGPIHKEALQAAGFPYPGHTEILTEKTNTQRYAMMLTSLDITCSLVTTHVGLREVPQLLSIERIFEVICLSAAAMERMRNRPARLIVCGLNPHAGEHGLFGDGEEEKLIVPAIELARKKGIDVIGPLPPDTAFLPSHRNETDCYVCMYHDQGLIPLKMLAFDRAVNVTLGLPIVRTSVDHGTACDIAWQGVASHESMLAAIDLAVDLATD